VTSLLLANATLYTPRDRLERAWLLVQDGRIAALGQDAPPTDPSVQTVDCASQIVAPGFVDLHTHGAGGADLMDLADGTDDAIRTIARGHAAGGTTAWFGSTVAAPLDVTIRVLDAAAPLVGQPLDGATLAGIHLEGPFLAHSQCGAHRPEHLLPADPSHVAGLLEALPAAGTHRLTAAPELLGALDLARAARSRSLHTAIGHSDATLDDVRRALDAGFSHVTHLYSCTSGMRIERGYKTPGINEAALLLDALTVELIGDGHHVPLALLQLVHKVKGPDRVCLVTDSMRATGLGPGTYRLGDWDVLVEDGVAKLPDRSKFAGSVCTMTQATRTAVAAGIPLPDALRMASETPAHLAGLTSKGAIAPGKDADLVLLDESLEVAATIVASRVVYERRA
jgi:N-acetylglucosamine-6-phosphate deacetylase